MPPKFEKALRKHNPPIEFESRGEVTIVYERVPEIHNWGFHNAFEFRDYLMKTAKLTDAQYKGVSPGTYEFRPKKK